MSTEQLRKMSKDLLGNKYRLELAAAIADVDGEEFIALGLSDQTGIRYPRVQEDLKRLLDAKMLLARMANDP